ncbi:MAG: hypothetical protein LHV69_07705 [Elusimicrobia bacterium]|nr:hypothetical protein [Candidatus Obscuribacterium magneticum]
MMEQEDYEATTRNIEFTLKIFRDPKKGAFVGQINGFTTLSQIAPGQPYPVFKSIAPMEIRHGDKKMLIELCKEEMQKLSGGPIKLIGPF